MPTNKETKDFQSSQIVNTVNYVNITFTSAPVTATIPAGSSYKVSIPATGVSAGERCVVSASIVSLAMYEVVAQANEIIVTVTNPRKSSSITLTGVVFTATVLRN